MPAVRFTLPYDAKKTEILRLEAKRQKRTFSNYLHTIFLKHLEKVSVPSVPKRKKRTRKK